ncbi:DUF938 domain-containing protein [Alteromonas sp. a30]|nr:DUF938 domain-containing protein [Alteromonas sp. a30]
MSILEKRFSQSCENNKDPILTELKKYFSDKKHVLEIGSGTGQHSVYFAKALAHLVWQTSDASENHPSILAYGKEAGLANWREPKPFFVGQDPWPQADTSYDAVFSANTAHIMQPDEVQEMFRLIVEKLPAGGVFCEYGPFKFEGKFTSDSNEAFDARLRDQGYGGYRDIEQLQAWGKTQAGELSLIDVIALPANNHLLVWQKQ